MDFNLKFQNTTGITIGIISVILLCFSLLRSSKSKHAKGREAPTVAGAWPILGHLPLLIGSQTPHKILGHMADKYGPLFTIKFGTKRVLVLSNWEMAKECFTKNDVLVSSRPKLVAAENLTYNQAMFGFAPYGPYWREIRKIATLEFFSNRRIELLSNVRTSEVGNSIKELFNFWSNNRNNERGYALVELNQWFAQLAFNLVLRVVAGKRFFIFGAADVTNERETERCLKALREFMRLLGVFTVADAVPCLRWLDLGGHEKAMKENFRELDCILSEWLEEHHQKKALGEKLDKDLDFMDVMFSALDQSITSHGFDADTIIKATTLSLISGATDTSADTLTWAICLLLNDPVALEKAKEELDTQIGKEKRISESDINKLVYLQAIVKETLRLHPAGPLSAPREFTEDCTLGGYHVRKGTRLITNLWKIQTDPSIWSDPFEFKPERFLTTHKEVDVWGNHFELLPFGSGRRKCPGISFGLHMVHLTLASFLHSFEILNPSSELIDMTETLGLTNNKATPLETLVKPRMSPKYYETL